MNIDLETIAQMFCPAEGILAKFTEVSEKTISQWLEEKGYLNEEKENDLSLL